MTLIDLIGSIGRRRWLRPLGLPIMLTMRQMRLSTMVGLAGRRMCIPSAGYPAVALTGSTIKENLLDGKRMFETLSGAIQRFKLEADGTISDLSIEPEACGCPVALTDYDTPYVLEHPVSSSEDIEALVVPEPLNQPRMRAMCEAVNLLSRRFTLPTVAGGSGPFTLAAELLGATEAAMSTITNRELMHELLRFCTRVCVVYLKALLKAGAEVILIGDPTAAVLSPDAYWEFAGAYTAEVIQSIGRPVILHICGEAGHLIERMCDTGAQALSLDSPVNLPEAAERAGDGIVIVGNLNTVSVLLEGTPDSVRESTLEMLDSMRPYPNYIVSSGCDLSYKTPVENIAAMIDTVRSFR